MAIDVVIYMKRTWMIGLLITLMLGFAGVMPALATQTRPEAVQEPSPSLVDTVSGYCGGEGNETNLVWTIDGEGVLTISGTGSMADYTQFSRNRSPWFAYKDSITGLVLKDGITHVGGYAFYEIAGLSAVNPELPESIESVGPLAFAEGVYTEAPELPENLRIIGACAFGLRMSGDLVIPDSVELMAEGAFSGCTDLNSVTIGSGVSRILAQTFRDCTGLTEVVLPSGLTEIGRQAFQGCTSLLEITIPQDVGSIGDLAFSECDNLRVASFLGNAPEARGGSTLYASFPADIWIHYQKGTSGWTDDKYYDPENPYWKGYRLCTVWTPNQCQIAPFLDEPIVINGKGYGVEYYRLIDSVGVPMAGEWVQYTIKDQTWRAITDGNGIVAAILPETTVSSSYELTFSLPNRSEELLGSKQTVSVTVKPLSYSQVWTGCFGAEGALSLGASVGAEMGPVELKASLMDVSSKASGCSAMTLSDEYKDGSRTLTLAASKGKGIGMGFKSGVEASVPEAKVEILSLESGAKHLFSNGCGVKIPNYDPENKEHLKKLGVFALEMVLASEPSVWSQTVLQVMELMGATAHNQASYGLDFTIKAGASVLAAESSAGEQTQVKLGDLSTDSVISYKLDRDDLDGTYKLDYTLAAKDALCVAGIGAKALVGSKIGAETSVLGVSNGNSSGVTASLDQNNVVKELVFHTSKDIEIDAGPTVSSYKSGQNVIYEGVEARKVVADNEGLQDLSATLRTLWDLESMMDAYDTLLTGDYKGRLEYSTTRTNGLNATFPIGVKLGVGAELKLSANGINELSYTNQTVALHGQDVYVRAVTTLSEEEVEQQRKQFVEILSEPLVLVNDQVLQEYITSSLGRIEEIIVNEDAQIQGSGEWYADLRSVKILEEQPQSYMILTLMDAASEKTNAVRATTVGRPYAVTIYTDETMATQVPSQALASTPVTLTLSYDQDQLTAAGLSSDEGLALFRYDRSKNMYVRVEGSVQNRSAMEVSAPISMHGEYILAVDSMAPEVSEFEMSDHTATPTLTCLVTDLSGVADFSFWVDDGTPLVDSQSFWDYYQPQTGQFRYSFEQPLCAGTHTAYFQVEDSLGIATEEPYTFEFFVDDCPPVIESVLVPDGPVTSTDEFRVVADVVSEDGLSQVLVQIRGENGESASYVMRQYSGKKYVADVLPAWDGELSVMVLARDNWGNLVKSLPQTVLVESQGSPSGVTLELEQTALTDCIEASVTVDNNTERALSGWLICAAYDEDGRFLTLGEVPIGLKALDSHDVAVNMVCKPEQVSEVKAMFLNVANGCMPICKNGQDLSER